MSRARAVVFCAAAVVATFVAPVAAHADHGCNGTVTDIGGVIYIDDRSEISGFVDDVWVYQESNGEAGLQSGGENPTGDYSDPCEHGSPDTLIY